MRGAKKRGDFGEKSLFSLRRRIYIRREGENGDRKLWILWKKCGAFQPQTNKIRTNNRQRTKLTNSKPHNFRLSRNTPFFKKRGDFGEQSSADEREPYKGTASEETEIGNYGLNGRNAEHFNHSQIKFVSTTVNVFSYL